MNSKGLIAILLLVVAVGLGWYFTAHRAPEQKPAVATAPPPPPTPQPVRREEPQPASAVAQKNLIAPPPKLDESDAKVHIAVMDIAPKLAQWLTPKEQIRKWVALVDAVATGKLPLKNRPIHYPLPAFMVKREDGKLLLDKENYPRTELLIKTITAIPPERLVQYYHAWQPLLNKAYADLGDRGTFNQRLHEAIKRILAVKPLKSPPQLVRPSVYYKYANPQLENANDIDKLMWRLGPENTKRIQNYLRQLQDSL